MRDHIDRYLTRGWHLVPLRANDKMPVVKDWVNAASNDRAQLYDWSEQLPGMNLGVACGERSGFWVVDVDRKAGGLESLLEVQRSDRRLPPTLTARTAGGGFHFLFEATDDFCPRNIKLDRLDRRLKGWETRGQGGQIVIAPSTVNGNAYRWEDERAKIAPPPRWLVDLIAKPKPVARLPFEGREASPGSARARLEGAARKLAQMLPETGRNNFLNATTFAIAEEIAAGRISENEIRTRMYEAARACGLTPEAAAATINSAITSAAAKSFSS